MNSAESGSPAARPFPRIVIVGAGLSGVCLAIKLKLAGIHSFTILEKSNDVGGTWLENSYPGAGCDIPSVLYSFSFAPKYDWSRKFAPQSEILNYFRDCADNFGVLPNIRLQTNVERADFDEKDGIWRVTTSDGDVIEADVFVSAVGQLNRPKIPSFEGLADFAGPVFHSARWDHTVDFADRDVTVVGSGASAIQLIPKLAAKARRVTVVQRTPNWIARRYDASYPRVAQQMFRCVPGLAKLYRSWIYFGAEWRILLYRRKGLLNKGFTGWLTRRMRRRTPQSLWQVVVPRYPAGCKRVLLSNDYLETLHRDNVEILPEKVERVEPDGIVTRSGKRTTDVIVLATGFETHPFVSPIRVFGREGVELQEHWQVRPRTYLGTVTTGFPNFFLLYGPNTNLGHNSIIFMVECQVRFIIGCLRNMQQRGDQTIEVRHDVVEQFDNYLQRHLTRKVWIGYVDNWYKSESGHIVNNWCGSTLAYWRSTRRLDYTRIFDARSA
jgi:cation diffusion facilitator CzcD-associated flavoprotein CzcO